MLARKLSATAIHIGFVAGGASYLAETRLLDRTRFVGICIFSPNSVLIYGTWQNIPANLIDAAGSRQHDWPGCGQSHQKSIEVGMESLQAFPGKGLGIECHPVSIIEADDTWAQPTNLAIRPIQP